MEQPELLELSFPQIDRALPLETQELFPTHSKEAIQDANNSIAKNLAVLRGYFFCYLFQSLSKAYYMFSKKIKEEIL